MIKENWEDVLGWSGYYSVSSFGRIKSTQRTVVNKKYGKMPGRKLSLPELILKPIRCTNGYRMVSFNRLGKVKIQLIHRVVALAFIKNPHNKPFVNHKNGIKTDNRLENLEWVTYEENQRHARDVLNILKGEKNPACKLTASKVKEIRELIANGAKARHVCKNFGIGPSQFYNIKHRRLWRHV